MGSEKRAASALPLRGLGLLLICVLFWSIGPLFIKYFTRYYDVWTQNAFRYSFAALLLAALAIARGRFLDGLDRSHWRKLMLVALANIALQVTFASAYYFIYPSVASLVGRVNIVFVTLLSFLLFHDERRVILSPRFLLGAGLALAGVCIVILGRDPAILDRLAVTERDFWIGVALTTAFAFFAALYFVTIKHAVRDIPPVQSFTHVAWMTALGLCITMLCFGRVSDLWRQPPQGLALMALSAFLAIAVAHSCYYAAMREVKAVVGSSMLQLVPLMTCLFSAAIYGDRLTELQAAGGIAVIGGAWLAALAQAKNKESVNT